MPPSPPRSSRRIPRFVERWFSTGIYPLLQRTITPISNLLPVALFDLMTVAATIWLVAALVRAIRLSRRTRQWSHLGRAVMAVVTAAAAGYLVFLSMWGLNYRRVPIAERLVVSSEEPRSDAVLALGLEAAARLEALHATAHASGWIAEPWRNAPMRSAFAEVQDLLVDAPDAVPGRLKASLYGLYFRWSGVDGMVDPFALEVIGNPDLLPWEIPFVAAHEWAHLAGYADESEANFVGWLTCLRGGAAAEYSGWLYLYWQVNGESGPDERARLSAALSAGPRRDIDAIIARMQRGQLPFLRNASWRVYDQYLRANRVEAGVAQLRRGDHAHSSGALRGRVDSRSPGIGCFRAAWMPCSLARPPASACFIRSRAISSGVSRPPWS